LTVDGFVCGLGGRDLTNEVIEEVYRQSLNCELPVKCHFAGSRAEVVSEEN